MKVLTHDKSSVWYGAVMRVIRARLSWDFVAIFKTGTEVS